MISSHCIWSSRFVHDFGFLRCVIGGYVVKASGEYVASIFRVGVAKVCRLYRHEVRPTHFTVYGASVTRLSYFSVFSVVFYLFSGHVPPLQGFAITFVGHTKRGTTHPVEWPAQHRDLYLTTHNAQQETDIQAPGEIQTHNPSKRAAAELSLRLRVYWDRPL
jgi:hypothetical protein